MDARITIQSVHAAIDRLKRKRRMHGRVIQGDDPVLAISIALAAEVVCLRYADYFQCTNSTTTHTMLTLTQCATAVAASSSGAWIVALCEGVGHDPYLSIYNLSSAGRPLPDIHFDETMQLLDSRVMYSVSAYGEVISAVGRGLVVLSEPTPEHPTLSVLIALSTAVLEVRVGITDETVLPEKPRIYVGDAAYGRPDGFVFIQHMVLARSGALYIMDALGVYEVDTTTTLEPRVVHRIMLYSDLGPTYAHLVFDYAAVDAWDRLWCVSALYGLWRFDADVDGRLPVRVCGSDLKELGPDGAQYLVQSERGRSLGEVRTFAFLGPDMLWVKGFPSQSVFGYPFLAGAPPTVGAGPEDPLPVVQPDMTVIVPPRSEDDDTPLVRAPPPDSSPPQPALADKTKKTKKSKKKAKVAIE